MIIPCIDLMGGKVVQLVQGRDKALEVESPFPLLTQFRRFPQLHVIDLDAALGTGANDDLMRVIIALDSKEGHVVVKGWRESVNITAEEALHQFEPYCSGFLCTYVDKEGMMQGTDLPWFRRLRAATSHEITAAGGISTLHEVRALQEIGIHAALGMALYTGHLKIHDLEVFQAAEQRPSDV